MSAVRDTGVEGRPEDIRAVPVRRPGRWVAAAIVLVIAVAIIHSIATQPAVRMGRRRRIPVRRKDPRRTACHDRADRHRDGDRDRARRAAGGDAPVAEPARLRRRAGSTSGSSAARRCSSRSSSGTSSPRSTRKSISGSRSGPSFIHANANTLIHAVHGGDARARPERGRLHGRDRARGDHLGR